eukprot:Em0013g213a
MEASEPHLSGIGLVAFKGQAAVHHDTGTCLPPAAERPAAREAAVLPAARVRTAEALNPPAPSRLLPRDAATAGAGFCVPSCITYPSALLTTVPLFSGATSTLVPATYSYLQPPRPHLIGGGLPPVGSAIFHHPYLYQEIPAFGPQLHLAPTGREGRPPFSYSALIAMAITSSPKKMMSLPEIYSHISAHFPYYSRDDKKWKNSVRHNLSLNKCFKKIPREEGFHGKGNYWMIDPASNRVLDRGSFRTPGKLYTQKIDIRSTPLDSNSQGTSNTSCKESECCCCISKQPKTNEDVLSFGVHKLLSRDPHAVLKALASTVTPLNDPLSFGGRSIADPLAPHNRFEHMEYVRAREAGKNAAKFTIHRWPKMFPKMDSVMCPSPTSWYSDLIEQKKTTKAYKLYRKLKRKVLQFLWRLRMASLAFWLTTDQAIRWFQFQSLLETGWMGRRVIRRKLQGGYVMGKGRDGEGEVFKEHERAEEVFQAMQAAGFQASLPVYCGMMMGLAESINSMSHWAKAKTLLSQMAKEPVVLPNASDGSILYDIVSYLEQHPECLTPKDPQDIYFFPSAMSAAHFLTDADLAMRLKKLAMKDNYLLVQNTNFFLSHYLATVATSGDAEKRKEEYTSLVPRVFLPMEWVYALLFKACERMDSPALALHLWAAGTIGKFCGALSKRIDPSETQPYIEALEQAWRKVDYLKQKPPGLLLSQLIRLHCLTSNIEKAKFMALSQLLKVYSALKNKEMIVKTFDMMIEQGMMLPTTFVRDICWNSEIDTPTRTRIIAEFNKNQRKAEASKGAALPSDTFPTH